MTPVTSLVWFRRDLRLRDNPALRAAAGEGPVLGVFVLDPVLWRSAGAARRAWLAANLRALDASVGGRLCVRVGDPASVLPRLAAEHGARRVHLAREHTPYGVARDRRVADALRAAGVAGVATGSSYAVEPGTVRTRAGSPYRVFTAFRRAWGDVERQPPVPAPRNVTWIGHQDDGRVTAMLDAALPDAPDGMPTAGEDAALRRWRAFRDRDLASYDEHRDRPDLDSTSRLSPYLHLGVLHPRQLLADLAPLRSAGAAAYTSELVWREFYGDVLHHEPGSAWADLTPMPLRYDDPRDAIEAWRRGTTGYPIVDAGMRQLLAEGWMHNRVRMITASFLTKDLHVWWPVGARHFLDHLVDGDVASNNHGWQWVAGTGTDAAPYFRVFNPVAQGRRFDPDGTYVRRWVPELRHLSGAAAHEPWEHESGYRQGYPARIVDHAEEREEALSRYRAARSR